MPDIDGVSLYVFPCPILFSATKGRYGRKADPNYHDFLLGKKVYKRAHGQINLDRITKLAQYPDRRGLLILIRYMRVVKDTMVKHSNYLCLSHAC